VSRRSHCCPHTFLLTPPSNTNRNSYDKFHAWLYCHISRAHNKGMVLPTTKSANITSGDRVCPPEEVGVVVLTELPKMLLLLVVLFIVQLL
jgi:hypothetical protein